LSGASMIFRIEVYQNRYRLLYVICEDRAVENFYGHFINE